MTKPLNAKQIEALRKIDTPTICNLLEIGGAEPAGNRLHDEVPALRLPQNLPPIVGYARTATIRAKEPGPLAGDDTCSCGSSISTMRPRAPTAAHQRDPGPGRFPAGLRLLLGRGELQCA